MVALCTAKNDVQAVKIGSGYGRQNRGDDAARWMLGVHCDVDETERPLSY